MNDSKLSYELKKGKPFYVCLHGLGLNKESFYPILKSCENEIPGYLIVDLPGHGQSNDLEKYNFKILASLISDLIEELKIGDFVLLAHSISTLILSQLSRNLKISKYIFIEGNVTKDETTWTQYLSKLSKEKIVKHHSILKKTIVNFSGIILNKKKSERGNYLVDGINQLKTEVLLDLPILSILAIEKGDISNFLKENHSKVFYIRGDINRKWNHTPQVLTKYSIDYIIVPNSSHFPHIEQPQYVMQSIKNFINS